jgi:hypothetical protein
MTEEANRKIEDQLQQQLDEACGAKRNVVRVADSMFDRMQARRGLTAKNQSQMAKITILQDVPEVEAPSREPYVQSLKEFRTRLNNAMDRLGTLKGISNSARAERLTTILGFLAQERRNKVPYGLGKFVRAAVNELVSLREAATLGDLQDNQIVQDSTHNILRQIEVLLAKEAELAKAGEETDDVFEGDVEGVLSLASAQTALPALEGNVFVLARVPVVPVPLAGFLATKKVTALGFDAKDAGGYAIMANQIVVGVSPKSASDIQIALEQFRSERLTLVSPRGQGKNGILWFWAMRETDLARFSQAFSGGSLKLQSWGLAI